MTIEVGKVGMIPLDKVTMSNRTREVMGNLDDLEENMRETGLISPLTVKDNQDGTYKLLAGGRRFTVLKRNDIDEMPARIYSRELTDLEMKVIEKSENFHRKDFEYWELDQLTMDIHEMQQQLHGAASRGSRGGGWKLEDTAQMLGKKSHQFTIESINRAKAREAAPDLFKECKTASDASKILRRVGDEIKKEEVVEKLTQENSNSEFNTLQKCFIVKDCFTGIKKVPDNYAHLVEIDPPYAINLAKQKRKDTISKYSLDEYNEIDIDHYILGDPDPSKPWRGIRAVLQEAFRILVPNSWLIFWFGPEPWENIIYEEITNVGFTTTRLKGIWTKGIGQTNQPTRRLANTYETFYYAWKGSPTLNKPGSSNVFDVKPIHASHKTHPTERPVELMREIYNTFCVEGSRIVIPFLGSGNGLFAARNLGMEAFGYDLSKSNKDSFLVKANAKMEGQIV